MERIPLYHYTTMLMVRRMMIMSHLFHCTLVPICSAVTRTHLCSIDDSDGQNYDWLVAIGIQSNMMMITMIVLLTGVTISRQDPGATQAQEASRCPSTLEKDISFSARSLVKLSFLPTAMDKACL